ncbi:MAG: hypothetical protein ABI861_04360, partial [Panacibacter sp.]
MPQHLTREKSSKQKRASQRNDPKPFSDSSVLKKNKATPAFIKRLSPFLVSALLLPLLTTYTIIIGIHLFSSVWIVLAAFLFAETYLLFLDFVIWNYYEGKK